MRVAITGANRGIGAELASQYRAAGHNVIATARDSAADISLDVSEPAQFAALRDGLGDATLDLLICNAGVYLDKGHSLEAGYAPELWAQSFAVNVTGVFLTIQTAMSALRRAQSPRIAIISSQMASNERAPGGSYIYRASKAAVLNLGRNLAVDLRSEGVAVGIYHPGWVQTDMGTGAADITVEASAAGLMSEFERLSIHTTGCFRTWDGRDHPM
ncbi:MAG: SDR family oxidoreductase [Arenibacterium sp.]